MGNRQAQEANIRAAKEDLKGKKRQLDLSEDEFGPSPMKDGLESFTELFEEDGEGEGKLVLDGEVVKRGSPSTMLGLFGKAGQSQRKHRPTKGPEPAQAVAVDDREWQEARHDTPLAETTGAASSPFPAQSEHSGQPGSFAEVNEDGAVRSAPTPRRPKVMSLSDDEQDEWDPEGGSVRHQIVITGTRRIVRKGRSSSSEYATSDGEIENEPEDHEPVNEDDGESFDISGATMDDLDAATPDLVEGTTTAGTSNASLRPSSPAALVNPSLLSMLSLHSPLKSCKDVDLRVKAIFNPAGAAKLKAMKRGQDVFVSGEAGDGAVEDDDYEWDVAAGEGEEGGEGDDDWEEEAGGWKETRLRVDDDEW